MARFHLHLDNQIGLTRDEDGQEFASLDVARAAAIFSIRDVLAEEVRHGRVDLRGMIRITDNEDRELAIVPFGEALAVQQEEGAG